MDKANQLGNPADTTGLEGAPGPADTTGLEGAPGPADSSGLVGSGVSETPSGPTEEVEEVDVVVVAVEGIVSAPDDDEDPK
ncbi:MAG: hypothetical protein ACLQUY_23080 [Ktedonobacterales bacterium]